MTNKEYTIGVDVRFAKTPFGIGRYTRELSKELSKRNDSWDYSFICPDIPYYSLGEQTKMPREIRNADLDLIHIPHFNVPVRCPIPFVVTIHDLILHHYPNEAGFIKRSAYKFLMQNAVKKSAHIIAVSQFTADSIKETYGEHIGEKITVIHGGVSDNFKPASEDEKTEIRNRYDLNSKFIIYTGSAKEHKNVQTLIDACPEELKLVLVTGGKEVANLKTRSNTIILNDVADEDLPALLSSAECFVFPSLEEGFGLPAIEAMACGCPVVASNRGSLPEVCDGNAIIVEPTVNGIQSGINEQLTMNNARPDDPVGREQLRSELVLYAKKFSWEKAAEETAKVYRKMFYVH